MSGPLGVLPSTEAVWRRDLAKIDQALHDAGAVKTLPDGFQYIDESVLPVNPVGSSLATVYTGLLQFGYANGYLTDDDEAGR